VTGQFVGIDGPKITIWALAEAAEILEPQGWNIERLGRIVRPRLEAATEKSRESVQVIAALNYVPDAK
jgi:hypothetical protein